jgi:hypothetical protein
MLIHLLWSWAQCCSHLMLLLVILGLSLVTTALCYTRDILGQQLVRFESLSRSSKVSNMMTRNPLASRDIVPFIKFHRLDVNEILEPIDLFSMCGSCNLICLGAEVVLRRISMNFYRLITRHSYD